MVGGREWRRGGKEWREVGRGGGEVWRGGWEEWMEQMESEREKGMKKGGIENRVRIEGRGGGGVEREESKETRREQGRHECLHTSILRRCISGLMKSGRPYFLGAAPGGRSIFRVPSSCVKGE